MRVVPVSTRSDRKRFIELPHRLNRGKPHWVPPLRLDESELLDPQKNPFFEHGAAELFLALDGESELGRIAAIEDRRHLERHGDGAAFFGFFEAASANTTTALLGAVEEWARGRGHQRVRGPFNPSLNDSAGLLLGEPTDPPYVLMPNGEAAYPDWVEGAGYRKVKDLWAWRIDLSRAADPRMVRIAQRVERRAALEVRPLSMRAFDRDLADIHSIFCEAWDDNWGFIPPSEREFGEAAKKLKLIIEPSIVQIAELDGEPVAFSVSLPDINQLLAKIGGRLLPFGLFRLLLGRRQIDRARMALLGVRKKHRHKGLFAPLILRSFEAGRRLGYREGECSWTLEDNDEINRAIAAVGAERSRVYRIYEKALA